MIIFFKLPVFQLVVEVSSHITLALLFTVTFQDTHRFTQR